MRSAILGYRHGVVSGFSLTGTRDGGHFSIQNPSITSHKSSSPIYIKEVNQTPQHAIIDTGSAGIIIHQQLLKIHHKKFIYKRKIHASASCTSVNIIGEIHLEIKIQGHKTWIVADVATNLVTDLLLGTDWIKQNRVIIDSPQQRVNLVNKCHKIIAYTPFVEPPDIRFPVFLIALPSYSEQCIDIFNISRSSQHSNSYMSSYSKKSSYYVTPLHKLDKLTQSYKSKKVIENDNYKQLYRTGECIPFQQPSSYHCHYIHHRTSIEILDKLIDGAHQTTHYIIDTKSTPSITSTIATCTHMYVI
ncbi:unnamed protein product [Didymodactylos carnosus]|uniref:Peptidase A2 domain-containing protein n=1 Tax=Didymodactylos carnosus TaxID=1234261 RepID=A0A8S2JKP8_9BILA|nr:unnamed protein product [Didymodactylos carnosus]CAF3812468.1 unnamed protein product [Didymodactylos carnosus]